MVILLVQIVKVMRVGSRSTSGCVYMHYLRLHGFHVRSHVSDDRFQPLVLLGKQAVLPAPPASLSFSLRSPLQTPVKAFLVASVESSFTICSEGRMI